MIRILLALSLVACSGNTASIGDAFDTPSANNAKASKTPTTQASPQSDENDDVGATSEVDTDAGTPEVEADAGSDPAPENDAGSTPPPPPPPPPPPSEPTDCPEIHNEFCRLDVYPKVYNYGYPKTCVSKYIRYYCAEVTYLGTPMYCCR